MKMNYSFSKLSRSEREFLEAVLMEELEMQTWYAVTYSKMFGEILVMVQ